MGKTTRRTNEEFIEKLKEVNSNVLPLEPYINNSTKIKCKCTIHNENYMVKEIIQKNNLVYL